MSYTIMKVLRNFCYHLISLACRRHPQIASNWLKVSFISVSCGISHSLGDDMTSYLLEDHTAKDLIRDIDSIPLMIPASKGKLGVWGWMPFRMKTTLSLLLWGILLVFIVTALLSAVFFNLLNVFFICSYNKNFIVWVYEHHKHRKWKWSCSVMSDSLWPHGL